MVQVAIHTKISSTHILAPPPYTGHHHLPLLKVGIVHAIGKALAANANALEHAVARQLMHHQMRVDNAKRLLLVGNNAAHKVRMRRLERGHQAIDALAIHGRHGLERARLLTLAAAALALGALALGVLVVVVADALEAVANHWIAALFEQAHDGVVERILVLLEPAGDVVRYLCVLCVNMFIHFS